jgi:hypothetical protein
MRKMYVYYSLTFGIGFLSLVVFFILQWLQIPAGNLIDWLIGIASFYWLLAIVTIPWNIHFEAKEVINEADISQQRKIPVNVQQIKYVTKVEKFSLIVAISLHIISAGVLYLLSFKGISNVGYITSIAALGLTFLRPAIRGYDYLRSKLTAIKQQIKYPREDIIKLKGRVQKIEINIRQLQDKFNLSNPQSFASIQTKNIQELKAKLLVTNNTLEELIDVNQQEHKQILKRSENAISQLTEDSQFLGNVKEIIRFIKTA